MTQDPIDPQQGSDISTNETAPEALLRVSSAVEKRMGQPQQGEMPFAVVQGEALTELPKDHLFRVHKSEFLLAIRDTVEVG